jgi:DNA modification methylase/predicted RNA-binding Zn-ribbon protein involved in translation (DUF1610 family)
MKSKSKKPTTRTQRLFRNPSGQEEIFDKSVEETLEAKGSEGLECFGMTFKNEHERQLHFRKLLNVKLNQPEFRAIEGFPIGSIEDILALSDPPFYTACPNPFLEDFLKHIGGAREAEMVTRQREAYSVDVSEGRSDPIYNLHSYHTKVPHKAIMRYILHYTESGDVVFDGFCGTGMTGIAAQLCGDRSAIKSLGYKVDPSGSIREADGTEVSHIGIRHAILSDLSPLATGIAAGYLKLIDRYAFVQEAGRIVDNVEKHLKDLYRPSDGGAGRIESTIWSDVFICPNCSEELVYWDTAVRAESVQPSFKCPHCKAVLGKVASKQTGATKLGRAFTTAFDPVLHKAVTLPKSIPVVENVKSSAGKRRLSSPQILRGNDLAANPAKNQLPWIPQDEFFPGRQTNKLINGSFIKHICHMYTRRALIAYATLYEQELSTPARTSLFRFCLTAINNYISRKQGFFGGGGGVAGTLFTPSIHMERNVFSVLRRKLKAIGAVSLELPHTSSVAVSTSSASKLSTIPSASIDYIFTDPPFGESLQYAELNHFIEAWLRVRTSPQEDCVLNYVHKKDLQFYTAMMSRSFQEFARILKPGRWMTVEFHNSQNSVWTAIQRSIEIAGLVVADVRVLDKQQRSFNAVNRSGAVDKDLIISAYKPGLELEERFQREAGTEVGVWDFVRNHLSNLAVYVPKGDSVEMVPERQSVLLFDRMVAFHVQRGVMVPLSASAFYEGLAQRFSERDEMYFLPEQVLEYDRKRIGASKVEQLTLFVTDEASALQWLRRELSEKPQTFQEVNPKFMKELSGWAKHQRPLELLELLKENFLCYLGTEDVPSQIHRYLSSNFHDMRNLEKSDPVLRAKAEDRWYVPDTNKVADLERLKERALLREFDGYRHSKERRIREFRIEAVRAGFRQAWQQSDYKTILAVTEKIPEDVLQEDPMLLMWYTNSLTRSGRQS